MKLVYCYNFEYNEEGEKVKVWIFSALGNACAAMDFSNALQQDKIDQQTHDALLANTYGGDVLPNDEYWLDLT